MSLHALSGTSSNLAARAGHLHAVRHAAAQVEIDPRSQVEERATGSESFVDVVSRQLSSDSNSFAPVAMSRRSKAVPFGRRNADDNYVGPIDLEQDEFSIRPSRVRRQTQQSPQPNVPTTNPPVWQNGDIGTVQAVYADGTFKNIMVANVVYASQGSEDGSALNAVPLRAQIQTTDGGAIQSGSLFALVDYLAPYVKDNGPKPWIGISTSQNTNVPFWMAPVTTVQNIWSIDTKTGVLTATYGNANFPSSVLQFATNQNTVAPAGSLYTGNGDTDAWPASGTIDSLHSAATLRLVKN